MNTKSLGLPLEYNKLSKYFGLLGDGNHKPTHQAIEKILKKYKVKTVLDLTCGTGSQLFYLLECGFKVTGSDLSHALLNIAKKRARQEKISVELLQGDMRIIQAGHFDAAITIHNAIGHVTKAGFEKTLRNIHKNLKENGLYIFDIFNVEAMTDPVVENLAMDKQKSINTTTVHHIQYSTLHRDHGLLTSYDQFVIQTGSKRAKTLKGKFTLQIYSADELREMLDRNGFDTVGQYAINGSRFSKRKSENILTVAKKR